ncbi:MAG: copper chaperone PCu(A)C [Burkholderiales bacterium]|nr:copper chaperone PCu(A)C [Burkholderiales bacterium]
MQQLMAAQPARRIRARALAALALAAVILGTAPLAVAQVNVSAPWVRGTVAPQRSTGAFMKIVSPSDAALVGAASPAAKQVEIHEMAMVNNVMRMRPIKELALPAGKEVELKPGGYHVMLMGIERQFKKGDVIPITLSIRGKDGTVQTVEVEAEVRELGAAAAPKPPMEHGRH